MFRRIALVFLLALLTSHSAQSQTLRIRIAVVSPPGTSVWRGAELYRERINRQLEGVARIELLPIWSINALSAVRSGEIEMAVVPSSALAASKPHSLALLDLPFFFRDLREVSAMQDSLVGEVMLGSVNEEKVLVGLAYWNAGMSHLFGWKLIQEADHLKGLKFRTTVSPQAQIAVHALGAQTYLLPGADVAMALDRGVIDLVESPPALVAQKLFPLAPTNYSNINYRPVVFLVVANTKFWRNARLRVQSALADEARAVADRVNTDAQESEKSATDILSREFKTVTASQAEFEAFSKAAAPGWHQVELLRANGFLDAALTTRDELRRINYEVPKKRSEPPPSAGQRVTIGFATDRRDDKAGESDPGLRFASARGSLSFGRVQVVLDPNRPSGTGDVSMVKLEDITEHSGAAEFAAALRDQLGRRSRREILLYIHGFRTTFKQAVESAAQLATDTKFRGVTLVFSWPSDGTLTGYPSDEENIDDSRDNFVAMLRALSAAVSPEKMHVITHSMGGRLAAASLEWLLTQPENRPKLYNLILAAPDVRVNQFTRALPGMKGISKRITLYASEWDQALHCSHRYHGASARVGQGGSSIVVFENVDIVDVSAVEKPSWLGRRLICTPYGHSYISQNHAVLADLSDLLVNDTPPKARQRLHEQKKGPLPYWLLK